LSIDRARQVKEALDIVEVIGGYVALRPVGPTYKGLCPFHDDHRPSFDVDPRRQRYRCWSCGKFGDIITFVMERERVPFLEAVEMLERRAGIVFENHPQAAARSQAKTKLLDVMRWAADEYQHCLLESELGDAARRYLGERQLLGPTIRKFGVGFAPLTGDWLVKRGETAGVDLEILEKLGLIARRMQGNGFYDRFRDRVQFPIRDVLGRTIGFGGRILPSSPLSARGPKYYNSPETVLFNKGEQVFGLDLARTACGKEGYVAVVEGYTDVLMAHQSGIEHVVATMGTALTARHVHHLRRFVPRVVLVFDADAGGETGVDRALEVFVSQDVDLAIATLPDGLDPCDLLTKDGGRERFREVLASAVDAVEFKLNRVLARVDVAGVEGRRRAVDAVLGVIALAPELPGQAGAVKRELIVSRISRRLALKEETVWARLEELRQQRRPREAEPPPDSREGEPPGERKARPAREERELLEILLAEPTLIQQAKTEISIEDVGHPGLQKMLRGLYDLHLRGDLEITLDELRASLDPPALAEWVLRLYDVGRLNPNRQAWLIQVLAAFRRRRTDAEKQELHNQLHAASDYQKSLELLRQLQEKSGQGSGVRGQ
jgi:DNA primase